MSDLTVTANPPLTATDRRLLAAVSRWAHTNGWEPGIGPGMWTNLPATWADSSLPLIEVWVGAYNGDRLSIRARRGLWGEPGLIDVDVPEVISVRLAVDLLVAYRVLPDMFSSAFAAGMAAAALDATGGAS